MMQHDWPEWEEFADEKWLRECSHCGLVQERVVVGGREYEVELGIDETFGQETFGFGPEFAAVEYGE